MIATLIIVALVLLFLIIIISISRSTPVRYYDDEDEIVTTHTTTTTTTVHEQPEQPTYDVVGTLNRQKEGNQYYVIDPVDKDKVWLNDTDDMYQDGAGKVWYIK